ncbi:MAG: hypothetical protein ACRC0V_08690 [Fusobacteriaceae bacterium]
MKRIMSLLLFLNFSILLFGNTDGNFGIVYDEDFISTGVTQSNLNDAKELMDKTSVEFKKLTLDKQQLEIEANKILLDGAEENLEVLDSIFDKIGNVEANMLKTKVRSQISMFSYITRDQYIKARELALKRIQESQEKITE